MPYGYTTANKKIIVHEERAEIVRWMYQSYMKAFVAIEGKMNDISKVDPDSDFYDYQIGFVFVDYYVEQFGGIKGFMALYCDSITMSDLYGRTIDELVTIAYHHNMNSFFKNKRAGAD